VPKRRIQIVIVLPLILLLSASSLLRAGMDEFSLTLARIQDLVDTGQCKDAQKAFNGLKTDFPEFARPDSNDFNLFVEAGIFSCTGEFTKAARSYSKLLDQVKPENIFYEAALDRQFQIASAFLAGRKKKFLGFFKIRGYAEGVRIMDVINSRLGFEQPRGEKAAVAVAECYQQRKKFAEAYYRWEEISEQSKSDTLRRDALLAMADCKLAQFKGHEYDNSDLIGRPLNPESFYSSARTLYKKFKDRYPEDADKFEIDRKLREIDEQMALKQFNIGQFYQNTGNNLSANLYYAMVIRDWPETDTANMARDMIITNSRSQEKTE
jgi:outer membrane protein assembly factor BamD (BamD/ComL family)